MNINAHRSTTLLAYYRQISTELFTVVDLETTGAKSDCDRIIEIAVVQATLKDGIQKTYTDLIDPQIPLTEQITQLTGLTDAKLVGSESADKVLPKYLPTLQTGILTAHNIGFDHAFLQQEYHRMGLEFQASAKLCTVQLSRLLLPNLPSRSLPKLVKHYGFDVGKSHRAESDALACWLLLQKLLTQILQTSDKQIMDLFGHQWLSPEDAATILQLPINEVTELLTTSKVKSRFSRHRQISLYQRRGIESLLSTTGSC